MIQMPECGSLEQFYRCVKEHMKKYRDTCDVTKIQNEHLAAFKEGSRGILDMKGEE